MEGMVHDGKGGASVTVTFKEYRPAKPKASQKPGAKAAGKSSGAGAGPNAKPDPNAKAKAELAALVDQAKKA